MFEDYIKYRIEKFGDNEKHLFRKVDDDLFESDRYLAISRTNALVNVNFKFVCANNGKFYYRNI